MNKLEELQKKCEASYLAHHANRTELDNYVYELKSKMFNCTVFSKPHSFMVYNSARQKFIEPSYSEQLIVETSITDNSWSQGYYTVELWTSDILELIKILDVLQAPEQRLDIIFPSFNSSIRDERCYILSNIDSIKENQHLIDLINSNDASNIALAVQLHKNGKNSNDIRDDYED